MFKRFCLFAIFAAVAAVSHAEKGADGEIALEIVSRNGLKSIAVEEMKYLCGVNSCFAAMRLQGKDPDYMELYRKLMPNTESAVSVADIERALGEYGVSTRTLKMRYSELYGYPGRIFIAYTPPSKGYGIGHFNVIQVINGDNIQTIDPPYPSKVTRKSDLKDGKTTIIAIGDGFRAPNEMTFIIILAACLTIAGAGILAYGKIKKNTNRN